MTLLAEIRAKLAEHETTGFLAAKGRLNEFVRQRGDDSGRASAFVNRGEVKEYADWLGLPVVTPLRVSPNFALAKLVEDGLELHPWTAVVIIDDLNVGRWFGLFSTTEDAIFYKLRFE